MKIFPRFPDYIVERHYIFYILYFIGELMAFFIVKKHIVKKGCVHGTISWFILYTRKQVYIKKDIAPPGFEPVSPEY